jgi:hypothetical protein
MASGMEMMSEDAKFALGYWFALNKPFVGACHEMRDALCPEICPRIPADGCLATTRVSSVLTTYAYL